MRDQHKLLHFNRPRAETVYNEVIKRTERDNEYIILFFFTDDVFLTVIKNWRPKTLMSLM